MIEKECNSKEITDDGHSWYAIRVFSLRLEEVKCFFAGQGLEYFIPEQYVEIEGKDGRPHSVLKPVVRNLIFIKQTISDGELSSLIQGCRLKLSVIKKTKESNDYVLIPHQQMYEFRLMCNPEITMRKYVSTDEARLKSGAPVFVKFGPLKGLTGRLVRTSKKYYLLKEVPGMGVMLKVSRWCCVPLEE